MQKSDIVMHSFSNEPLIVCYIQNLHQTLNTESIFSQNKLIDVIAYYTSNIASTSYKIYCRDKTVPIKQFYNYYKNDSNRDGNVFLLTKASLDYLFAFKIDDFGLLDIMQNSETIEFSKKLQGNTVKCKRGLICYTKTIKEEWFDKMIECIKQKYNYIDYLIFKKDSSDFDIDYKNGEITTLFDYIFIYNEYSLLDSAKILEYKSTASNTYFLTIPGINDISKLNI